MSAYQKRKNYFIDKSFQSRFIITFCLVVVLSSMLIIGYLLLSLQNSNTVAIENTKVTVKKTADFIFPITLETVLVVSLFSGAAVLVLTLLASHKISGPLFRLTKDIDKLSEGDLSTLFRIRGNDQLQQLAQKLNDMTVSLKEKLKLIKSAQNDVKSFLNDKNKNIPREESEELLILLNNLEEKINNFKS